MPAAQPAPACAHERQLHHLHYHQVAAQLLEDAPHDQLVHAGAEQEGDERGRGARDAERADGRVVDVSQQECVHGAVPVARELVPRRAVPPVGVEAAVGEEGEFGQNVELDECELGGMDEKNGVIGLEADCWREEKGQTINCLSFLR